MSFGGVMSISVNAQIAYNPFDKLTIPLLLLNVGLAFVFGYLQMALAVVVYRKFTSFLRRTYTVLHNSVENSAWINRVLYGPDWQDEVDT
jgi:hypothetical protein